MRLSREKFVRQFAEKNNFNINITRTVINDLIDFMCDKVVDGDVLVFNNAFVISTKTRKSYIGRHPKTHEKINISGKTTLQIKAAKSLEDRLNENIN